MTPPDNNAPEHAHIFVRPVLGDERQPAIGAEQLELYQDTIRKFREAGRGTLDFEQIKELFRPLDSMAVVMMPVPRSIYHRGRRCRDGRRWDNVKDLKAPDAARAGLGRASLPGRPVLYGANTSAAAFCECRVQADEVIQLIHFMPKHTAVPLAIAIGDLNKIFRSAASLFGPHDISQIFAYLSYVYVEPKYEVMVSKFLLFDAFISEQFGLLARDPSEYKLTAMLADRMLKPPYKSILFPSVAFPGGSNIAILPDEFEDKFVVVASTVLRMKRLLDYGIWTSETLARTEVVLPNGDFIWSDAIDPREENIFISCRTRFPPTSWGQEIRPGQI